MDDFLRYQKILTAIILGILVAGAAVLYCVRPDDWQYGAGLLWGGAWGLITFRMKVLNIIRFAQDPRNPPAGAAQFRQLLVMVVCLGILIAVNHHCAPQVGHDVFNKWTAFAGLLLPTLVLAGDALLRPGAMIAPAAAPEKTSDPAAAPATPDAAPAPGEPPAAEKQD